MRFEFMALPPASAPCGVVHVRVGDVRRTSSSGVNLRCRVRASSALITNTPN